ncbi:hypothetical protein [Chelativorans sp. AA-79]|uniref:hypothetical protein n=1 Tax=Chelativorans sp. AA-79 TaxID=3028735 RepID=UPI0023F7EA35|nr:hypothetical protein [Chelativorans sp. AA-79]WEX12237.1 hypothetical protein PVE73_26370 [Chelativorans sp. AA-79]
MSGISFPSDARINLSELWPRGKRPLSSLPPIVKPPPVVKLTCRRGHARQVSSFILIPPRPNVKVMSGFKTYQMVAGDSLATASAQGSTVCVFILRLKPSCSRSIAILDDLVFPRTPHASPGGGEPVRPLRQAPYQVRLPRHGRADRRCHNRGGAEAAQHGRRQGQIKAGKVPDTWKEKPAKLRQKDRDMRWTVKFSKAKADEKGKARQCDTAAPSFGTKPRLDRSPARLHSWLDRVCSGGNRAKRQVACLVEGDTGWEDGMKWRLKGVETPEYAKHAECARKQSS